MGKLRKAPEPPVEPDHQLKVPVVRRSEYTLFLEQATPGHTFIHCDVRSWTPRSRRQLTADWAALFALHGGPLYAMHTPGDAKHLKFLTIFGFRPLDAVCEDADGRPQELFVTKDNP